MAARPAQADALGPNVAMAARPAQADALGPWPSGISRTERRHGGPTATRMSKTELHNMYCSCLSRVLHGQFVVLVQMQ